MIVELSSGPDLVPGWRFRFQLTGPWTPLDQFRAYQDPALQEELRLAGAEIRLPEVSGGTLLFAASMTELATPVESAPPLLASLVVSQGPYPSATAGRNDRDLQPIREVSTTTVDWPDGEGPIDFHQVRYVFPCPSADSSLALAFSTPNLPLADAMETLFDVIVSSGAFYVDEVA